METEPLLTAAELAEALKVDRPYIYRQPYPRHRLGTGRQSAVRYLLSEVLRFTREENAPPARPMIREWIGPDHFSRRLGGQPRRRSGPGRDPRRRFSGEVAESLRNREKSGKHTTAASGDQGSGGLK